MNKKLLFSICAIILFNYTTNHTSSNPMVLPEDESSIWKWSPLRIASHAIWGTQLGQDFWEANSTELNKDLEKFKTAKNDTAKIAILQKVMEKSATGYQKVINTFQENYRSAMSYIIDQFQKESKDSHILYLPDAKLVTMYKKNASDEEKMQVMHDLIQEGMKKKSNINPIQIKQTTSYSNYSSNQEQMLYNHLQQLRQQAAILKQAQEQQAQQRILLLKQAIAETNNFLHTQQLPQNAGAQELELQKELQKLKNDLQPNYALAKQNAQTLAHMRQELEHAKQASLSLSNPAQQELTEQELQELQAFLNKPTAQEQKSNAEISELEKTLDKIWQATQQHSKALGVTIEPLINASTAAAAASGGGSEETLEEILRNFNLDEQSSSATTRAEGKTKKRKKMWDNSNFDSRLYTSQAPIQDIDDLLATSSSRPSAYAPGQYQPIKAISK